MLKLRNDTRSNLRNSNDKIDNSSDEEDEKDEMSAISDDGTLAVKGISAIFRQSPSMSSPKQSSSRNQSTSHMVPGSPSGKKKKQKFKETTQQDNSTEL